MSAEAAFIDLNVRFIHRCVVSMASNICILPAVMPNSPSVQA